MTCAAGGGVCNKKITAGRGRHKKKKTLPFLMKRKRFLSALVREHLFCIT